MSARHCTGRSNAPAAAALLARRTLACWITAAASLGAMPSLAHAQKANPQPLEPYIEPSLDVNLWRQVYAMANRPRILVLCGYGTDRHQAMDPAQVLSNLDSTAVTHKIRAAVISELNAPGADVEMVDDNALRAVMTRLKDNTTLSGDMEAGELLKQQLGADLVVLIRLTDSGLAGSPFSVVVEATDLARGRKGATFPFDWKGGTDVMNIKANASAVAIKFVNDFALRTNDPVRYTVQVFGADTLDMQRSTLDALAALPGQRGQPRSRTSGTVKDASTGKQEAFTEYELAFVRGSDGDATQIASDIGQVLRSRYNIIAEPRQSEGGRIAIRVRPGQGGVVVPSAPAPVTSVPATVTPAPAPAPALEVPTTSTPVPTPVANPVAAPDAADTLKTSLKSLYTQKSSPRVVVLINRAATIDEWDDWRKSAGVSAGNIVVVSPAAPPADPAKRASEQFIDPSALELWARQVEQAVSQSLASDYGVTMQISPDLARASLLTTLDNGQHYMGADQLLGLLRKEDVADIAVVACGKIVSGVAGYEMVYTLETVELPTSRRIGSALITSPLRGLSASDAVRRSSESFASRAASQAANSLQQAWSAASSVEVTITGLASDEEARKLTDAIKAHSTTLVVGGGSSFKSDAGAGSLTFTATYSGPADQVGAELQRVAQAASLPFAVSVTSRSASKIALETRR